MLCGREEEGEGRRRRVGGAGVRDKQKREKKAGEKRKQEGKREGRGRREERAGWEWKVQRRRVKEQEDGSTKGTDGLLRLGRVLSDKDVPCSVLKLK